MCVKKGETYNVYYEETNPGKWPQRIKNLVGEAEWETWHERISGLREKIEAYLNGNVGVAELLVSALGISEMAGAIKEELDKLEGKETIVNVIDGMGNLEKFAYVELLRNKR